MNSEEILVKTRPATSVIDFSRDELIELLRKKLKHHDLINAWLTGSCATGNAGPWSDIDVVIIKETDLPFPERCREFQDLLEFGIPVDVFVYTPEEASAMNASPTPFWNMFKQQRLKIL